MDAFWLDLRHAWRAIRRDPGPSLTVVLILALGIGVTVSVYSITAGVVLRPLPYADADRLVQIRQIDPSQGFEYDVSGPTFADWLESSTALSGLAVVNGPGERILARGEEPPTRVPAAGVSGGFFSVLGLSTVAGRPLTPADAETGARVAVLSYGLWQRFGGDASVVGSTLRLDGDTYEVVGVAEPELALPAGTEIWTPLPVDAPFMAVRHANILPAFGRLAEGATPVMARQELAAINQRIEGYEVEPVVVPLKDQLVGDVRTPLLILLGAVCFVLLVAAANAGTLLLARSVRRRRELAIRDAMGAGWRRLTTQLMAESGILAGAAGVLGVLAAAWLVDGLVALAPADLPRVEEIGLDTGVLGFAVVVSMVAGVLTGLLPAVRGARTAPVTDLKEGDVRGGGRASRAQRAFVVAEVALSVVLLFGAGLLGRSFYRIMSVDPGFETERVTTFAFSLPSFRYQEEWQVRRYHDEMLAGIRALPGVTRAGLSRNLPVGGSSMVSPALVEGLDIQDPPRVQISAVSPGYFETLGLDPVAGRTFTDADGLDGRPVVVVNEAFVRAYLEGGDAVGRRARTYFDDGMRDVVGVVPSTAHSSRTETPEPKLYYPAAQMPPTGGRFVVRSDAPAEAVMTAVRQVALDVDPEVPLGEVATMSRLLARTTAEPRFFATTMGVFAGLALVLAVAGFFAVLSQAVTARRREMGVRIAIGAEPGDVLRLVVRDGLKLTGLGVGIGVMGGLAGARLLRGLLYEVPTADPVTLVSVAGLMGAVALVATWVPARRAAGVEPMEVLRQE